jgi:hypothetical protein
MKPVFAIALGALALAQAATAQQAAQPVTLKSETFVAKAVVDANGNKKNELQPALKVLPGDPLVFLLSWKNNTNKPVSGFVINNPIPESTVYTGAREPAPMVSVDGGKTFGSACCAKGEGCGRQAASGEPDRRDRFALDACPADRAGWHRQCRLFCLGEVAPEQHLTNAGRGCTGLAMTKTVEALVRELESLLTVEEMGGDRFLGHRLDDDEGRIYGGEIIAQALASAMRTVSEPERVIITRSTPISSGPAMSPSRRAIM